MIADPDKLYTPIIDNVYNKILHRQTTIIKRELSKDIYCGAPLVPPIPWRYEHRGEECPQELLVRASNYVINNGRPKYERNIVINSQDGYGYTLLAYACRIYPNTNKVKLLIEHGANPNYEPIALQYLFSRRSGYHYVKTINYLLDNGADVNVILDYDHQGVDLNWNVLTYVDIERDKKLFEILLKNGLSFNIIKRKGLNPIVVYGNLLRKNRSPHFKK